MKTKIFILFIVISFLVGISLVSSISDIVISNEFKKNYDGISNLKIEGDILKLNVDYGGCEKQKFNLVWNGEYLKSIPPQVNLHLSGDNNDSEKITCARIWYETLEFDLKKLKSAGDKTVIINFFQSPSSTPKYKLTYNYGEEQISNNTGICPADLKICPDGTSVGRELPNCEFPVCPSECDVIGLRSNRKYCSSDKIFLSQKEKEIKLLE